MNAPPDVRKRNARAGAPGVPGDTAQQTTHPSTFRVLVDGKRPGMLWREYSSEREAQRAAANLRKIGMAARVQHIVAEIEADAIVKGEAA